MPLAAPLILPFAELAGITIAGLGMAAASKKISDFISDNPETSMQILTMLVPGGQGLNALFRKKASVTSLISQSFFVVYLHLCFYPPLS